MVCAGFLDGVQRQLRIRRETFKKHGGPAPVAQYVVKVAVLELGGVASYYASSGRDTTTKTSANHTRERRTLLRARAVACTSRVTAASDQQHEIERETTAIGLDDDGGNLMGPLAHMLASKFSCREAKEKRQKLPRSLVTANPGLGHPTSGSGTANLIPLQLQRCSSFRLQRELSSSDPACIMS